MDDRRLAQLLEPADHRAIAVRLLRNLKASYERRECWEKALRCADRLAVLCPYSPGDLREDPFVRGLLAKLPASARATFSDEQLLALKAALGGRACVPCCGVCFVASDAGRG